MGNQMRICDCGPEKGKPCQLSTYVIVREYMATHGIANELGSHSGWLQVLNEHPELAHENFTPEQLNLSLDDFSRSLGWMQ